MRALVADDEVISRRVLEHLLRRWGYDVSTATSGDEAWHVMGAEDPPSIAVIDWMMPGIDGVELSRRLRATPRSSYPYLILVTSLDGGAEIEHALEAGVDDFIRKPVDAGELRRRLTVARRVAIHGDRVRRRTDDLEELAESRARQLNLADRMATLGMLAAGVAHEVNNPAAFVAGNVQTLKRFWAELEPVLRAAPPPDAPGAAERRAFMLAEVPAALEGIHDGARRIAAIVRQLKSYARHEVAGQRTAAAVRDCIDHALELCRYRLAAAEVTATRDIDAGLPPVLVNAQEVEQVLVNLFVNAADAMSEVRVRRLDVQARRIGDHVTVTVTDTGPGISAEARDRIWDPFFTTKPVAEGTGLGLSISRSIAQAHGGDLTLDPDAGAGARFRLSLPAMTEDRP